MTLALLIMLFLRPFAFAAQMPQQYAISLAKKAMLEECAQRTVGKSVDVDYQWEELCKKNNFWWDDKHSQRVQYRLSNVDGVIRPEYDISLHFQKVDGVELAAEKKQLCLELARDCLDEAEEFWAQNGLWVRIRVDSADRPLYLGHQSVIFWAEKGRSRARNWYACLPEEDAFREIREAKKFYADYQSTGTCHDLLILGKRLNICEDPYSGNWHKIKGAIDKAYFCRMVLHETGHHMGLRDQYKDSACPDRRWIPRGPPFSIMFDPRRQNESMAVWPDEMESVVAPPMSVSGAGHIA